MASRSDLPAPHPNLIPIGRRRRLAAAASLLLTTATQGLVLTAASSPVVTGVALALIAAALATFGSATDTGHRRRVGGVALVAMPAAVLAAAQFAGAVDLAAAVVVGALSTAVVTGIAAPPLAALVASGMEVRSPATPRMRFMLGIGSPWSSAARATDRLLLPLFTAAGLLGGALGVLLAPAAPVAAAGLTLAVVAGIVAVAVRQMASTISGDRMAEAWARLLLAGTLAGLCALVLATVLPTPVAASFLGLAILTCLLVVFLRPAPRPGRAFLPGTPGYRRAVRGFERSARPRPDLAITATSVSEVRSAIRAAGAASLGVVANSTGHAASSLPDLAGTALVRVSVREPITVDSATRTVRIPAGSRWGDVVEGLAPTGLIAPHGSSALVGAIGYLLRGGLSFYGRASGVAANSIESIELVTADGTHTITDRDRDPELFWALRGGGGGFGIITALTLRLFPVTALTTGTAFWTADHAPALLSAWSRWHCSAPREASTTFRIMRLPPLPGIPRALSGRPVVNVDGVIHSREAGGGARVVDVAAELLDPLRRIATPVLDTWRPGSVVDVPWTHMDPALAVSTGADHQLLKHLDGPGQAALLDIALRPRSPLATIELRQLGGAFDDTPDDGGALDHLRGATSLYATGLIPTASLRARTERELADLRSAIAPWGTGYTAPNYAEDRRRPQRTFPDDIARRVDSIRKRCDPTGMFAADIALGAVPAP
jgi:hypothetical protein